MRNSAPENLQSQISRKHWKRVLQFGGMDQMAKMEHELPRISHKKNVRKPLDEWKLSSGVG